MQDVLHGVFHGLVLKALHGHFHVALAGAEPQFADEDVVEYGLFAVRQGYAVGAAGLGCGYGCFPLAVLAGFHAVGLAVP